MRLNAGFEGQARLDSNQIGISELGGAGEASEAWLPAEKYLFKFLSLLLVRAPMPKGDLHRDLRQIIQRDEG